MEGLHDEEAKGRDGAGARAGADGVAAPSSRG